MKKFITGIMLIIAIMSLTGCSREGAKNPVDEISEGIIVKTVIEQDKTDDNILRVEQDYKEGKVSKEYYEEYTYNSQKNRW